MQQTEQSGNMKKDALALYSCTLHQLAAIRLKMSSTSDIDCHRCGGCCSRQPLMTTSKAGGMSAVRCASAPWNTGRPVIISQVITPKAKISVRESVWRPSICSGAMYGKVPDLNCDSGTIASEELPDSGKPG